ncbi:hypothetical protein [Serratia liquefaciens]|uniref:hypothetical protein n=1 Tax=Serratia liquefaciens TaxID=614 RepID=UPI002183A443|nr:hypothetical protein [Serratia liquefaciens]CAI2406702.1 Uncharacterised protein [Serratia liquefaciens]
MTKTLTTEAMQEIYEAAVHSEATGDDQDAHFELLCKLEDVGGTGATIRKLIDMVRAANREAQPVGYIAEVSGNRVGVLRGLPLPDVGSLIYTAPPAPVVNPEFTGATAVPEEMTKEDAMAFVRERPPFKGSVDCVQATWNACRAAMLAQPVSQGYKLPPHTYSELVNSLRDTAVKYSGTDQLRERLNTTLSQFIEPDHPHTRTAAPDSV